MKETIDERLIQLLENDARQSSEKLARQLKVSPSTVRRRIASLIRTNVLRAVALVDPTKVGFPLICIIGLDVAHNKLESAMDVLAHRPEVTWVSSTTGRFDVLIVARFSSTYEISSFMQKELAKMEGLKDTETFVCLQVKKGRFMRI